MKNKKKAGWLILPGFLLAFASLLRFALRGYAYWAYAIAFLAALIVLHHVCGSRLWRIIVILVCIGLVYFCIVEIPIEEALQMKKTLQMDRYRIMEIMQIGGSVERADADML